MQWKWKFSFMSGAFGIALGLFYILLLRAIAVQVTPPPDIMNEPYPDISTEQLCDEAGGRWVPNPSKETSSTAPVRIEDGQVVAYCQGPLKFEREREIQLEDSRQTSLLVFAIGGALAVAGALLWPVLAPIAPGLMVGGIVSFFITAVHVWMLSASIGRLITLVVIFAALAVAGLYAFRDKN
ncbi:MAG: hypothetical protein HYR90_04325 [Candidatus Andersenbacteria bacterium]|nr:hypothetical protein [Candidatus Andersenbacteria bacterium]MBI3250635.1 hypothetical protein [Candidatus Andersenbacteria bacterium]